MPTRHEWHSKDCATSGEAITPANDGTHEYDAVFVGNGGDLKVLLRDDTVAITLENVGDGEFLPIAIQRVYATGTTASSVIGLIKGK